MEIGHGYAIAVGPCYACGYYFSFDPERVPSVIIDGTRRALCRPCVDRVNPMREADGLAPIIVLPGAYGPDD